METWIGIHGCVNPKYESEFDALERQLIPIFKPLTKRMTHKELYQVAEQAAVSAVGSLVRAWAQEKDAQRKPKRRRTKS